MGIPEHLTCLWRTRYAGQEATVRTGHGTTDWFQIEKEYIKAVYCHSAYLTYMQSISWEMLGWRKHKLESRLLREISITSDMLMTPTQHSKNEDHGIWSHNIMANRWVNNDRLNFGGLQNHCRWGLQPWILGGSKITADGDCSSHLLLIGKAMTNLDSILKSRDVNFTNKGPSSQSYGFSSSHVWMWELDYI